MLAQGQDNWRGAAEDGKREAILGGLRMPLDPADDTLPPQVSPSVPPHLSAVTHSQKEGRAEGEENHGFWVLQAAGLKTAYGEGSVRHCHSWVGAGCCGYPGRQLPKVTQLFGVGLPERDLRGSPLFLVCLPCPCAS